MQIDEPIFSLDLNEAQRAVIDKTYAALARVVGVKIMVTNYFGELRDNLELFASLPVSALHIDAVRGAGEIEAVAERLPGSTVLSLGVVDGRNIWKTDLAAAKAALARAQNSIGADRLMVGPASSLLHSPVTLRNETRLDARLADWLAFAEEKLAEIAVLAARSTAMSTKRCSRRMLKP